MKIAKAFLKLFGVQEKHMHVGEEVLPIHTLSISFPTTINESTTKAETVDTQLVKHLCNFK